MTSSHEFLFFRDNFFAMLRKNPLAAFINFPCLEVALDDPWPRIIICSINTLISTPVVQIL